MKSNNCKRHWRLLNAILLAIAFILAIAPFQNCGGIQTPKVSEEMSVLKFNHSVLVHNETCMQCHEKDRKNPSHYSGQDCRTCHVTQGWPVVSGASGHTPDQPECASCHMRGGTRDSIATFKPDHFNFGSEDCLKCHQASKDNGFVDWRNGTAHSANLTACGSCHGVGQFKDSITRLKPDHFDFSGKDCYECHFNSKTNGFVDWTDAIYGHSPTLNQCASCHGSGQSQDHIAKYKPDHFFFGAKDCFECHQASRDSGYLDWKGSVFVHSPSDISGQNCNLCHDSAVKPRPASGNRMQGTGGNQSHYAKFDCYSCHSTASAFRDWDSGGTRHKNAIGNTVPFCLPCHFDAGNGNHGVSEPTWFQPPSFDISVVRVIPSANAPLDTCSQCHQVDKTWQEAVGTTAHTPTQNQCGSCHGKGQSSDHITKFKPNHFDFGVRDCFECHQSTRDLGYQNWTGGVYLHTAANVSDRNCNSCHETDRPSSGQRMQGTGSSHYGKFDCYSCHSTDQQFGDWGSSSTRHKIATGAKVQFCLPCHYNKGQDKHRKSHPDWFQPPTFDIAAVGVIPTKSAPLGSCNDCHTSTNNWD